MNPELDAYASTIADKKILSNVSSPKKIGCYSVAHVLHRSLVFGFLSNRLLRQPASIGS